MKTNHSRGYVAKSPEELRITYVDAGCKPKKSEFSDRSFYAKWFGFGSDRQNRRHKAGAKKFVRSRLRHHDKAKVREILKEV